ncbi:MULTISPECIES: hypothetical protein [Methylococcus]|uniref:Bacteriophage-related protein n=1 Tax=Methylococcus capsulatus TaxID=414 RepID=A0ABZ2F6W8_METCP|nr:MULTISPECIES: hypothetical protein [Methylococcus]
MSSKKHYGRQTGRPITHELTTPAGGVRLETFVPWTLVRRGLKKRVITPLDAPQEFLVEAIRERETLATAQDSALIRALGLAHHWQRLLDEERAASVAEIAKAEGMNVTQVRRVMRLTLLAPEVIERLVGAPDIVLEQVMRRPWPGSWSEQFRFMRATVTSAFRPTPASTMMAATARDTHSDGNGST